ncbi:hypothetical protein Pyrde_0156 [Pyrodictium delaneyi]|uniref:Phosphoadenosine phosphosulphate reductase domain-containing protein n=1 Tax=Pyrodictium delaneyi TaxID=1273541 RepID=A0A0P0N1U9_9CREN|nr:phosphoadenosine phosphosulfate reductase family protein [Pyrodictium delaneyi]ALL00206.1 hypothetical protein Pyrde_0156 [Pyrodictium delaneyi]OWJ54290.1 hypothetical protein Pdsh_07330 [Pyrodictium delaneyi]
MFTIVTRSKRDADAVKAMIERFYPGWGIDVKTLHGARSGEAMLRELSGIIEPDRFYIVLLGREDRRAARELIEEVPPNVVVHVVPRSRVRNARLELLYAEVARARAVIRVTAVWDEARKVFLLGPRRRGQPLEGLEPQPSFDNFIGLGRFAKIVSRLAGGRIGLNPLVVRTRGGLHLVYNGPKPRAELEVRDEGLTPQARIVGDDEPVDVNLEAMVEANRSILQLYERASLRFLESLGEFDTIVVPWSGGKDSTAILLLAITLYGRDKVRVVYGDTGTEFPLSKHYVEELAQKLGIEYVEAYGGVDKMLLEGVAPMPTHSNRWCTGLKVAAIEGVVKKLAEGRTLLLVGDRDAESPRRSARPPVRPGPADNITMAAPIKLWGGAHVQLYVLSKGVPLNPMYEYGFYRIGCYMCPALRNWELHVLTTTPRLHLQLLRSPIYRRFVMMRLRGKTKAADFEPEEEAACSFSSSVVTDCGY